jgi:hypothetical protein
MGDGKIKESDMAKPKVWVFFYGSFINLDVLRGRALSPTGWRSPGWAGSTS